MNQKILLWGLLALFLFNREAGAQDIPAAEDASPDIASWSGTAAMDLIAAQLSFGSSASATPDHQRALDFIQAELAKTTAAIGLQQWDYTTPDGHIRKMTNIVARFDLTNPRRIIVGAHYNSIAKTYRDPAHPEAVMPGANNAASGVALLLETAHRLSASKLHTPIGVDMVFFDGKEGGLSLGAGDSRWLAIGSPYFGTQLDIWYPSQRPEKAVIFDMVCYKDLKLYPEKISMQSAGAEVTRFWNIGSTIAPDIFSTRMLRAVYGDQYHLINAGIPSFLVVGFDYAPWFNTTNTTQDTMDKCSPDSLEAVGRTLLTYLFEGN